MKLYMWSIVGLLMVGGCHPSEQITEPPATPAKATPTKTTVPETKPTPEPAPQTKTSTANPNRVYQLSDLKVHPFKAGGKTLNLWLMDNESKRQEGMMFLVDKDVKADQGMLFVFKDLQPNDGKHGFWMQNCPLALDIAYISPKGKVLNVAKGMPFNTDSLPPAGDYQYVIEVKQGLAAGFGIKAGAQLNFGQLPTPVE
jgi:uncharacterized membrane protein (UPF0127 family)